MRPSIDQRHRERVVRSVQDVRRELGGDVRVRLGAGDLGASV